MKARALMYHDVVEGSPDIYSVTPDHFREHLERIERDDRAAAGAG